MSLNQYWQDIGIFQWISNQTKWKNDGAYTFDFKFYFKNEKALHKLKK